MPQPSALTEIVRQRLDTSKEEIEHSLVQAAMGNPLGAEPSGERLRARLQAKASLTTPEAEAVARTIETAGQAMPTAGVLAGAIGAEAVIGTFDFVGVAFLEAGRRAADAVGRVAFRSGRPQGSGFMVAPGLFLTNHHVIESPAQAAEFVVEFDYEYGLDGAPRPISRFAFDPQRCFVTEGIKGLDFTLIAIGARVVGPRTIDAFGYVPLSDASDKHALGEVANVVQHPDGRFKEVVLRENHLVSRDETQEVLHYIADTEPGSSGSPVFNNEWEPIALHHWAGPYREVTLPNGQPLRRDINEGIRISAIVKNIRRRSAQLGGATGDAVGAALALWDTASRSWSAPTGIGGAGSPEGASQPRSNADGSVTWVFPIEISVRAPLLGDRTSPAAPAPSPDSGTVVSRDRSGGEAAAMWTKEDFSDRGGYEPGFIPGFVVPLPTVQESPYRIAENQLAGDESDRHELRYHHFSIVMNADRRLAFLTACNIDGARSKAIVRRTKTVIDDPTPSDLGVESLGAENAEASDDFRPDRRILPAEQMTRAFYEKQNVPGFPDPNSGDRIARMFQKGHIIMRGDPAWGSDGEALAAERDTFFYTNAAPQVGFFNQGSRLDRPGSKGKLRWRAVETYVLRNAVTMRDRIIVFAGPIFAEDDPTYRFGVKVPMRFWKIVVWADAELRAIALLADQREVLKVMPEAIVGVPEAFADSEEIARVSEFLSNVATIEELTGIDFGDAVRRADIRTGESESAALNFDMAAHLSESGGAPGSTRPPRTKAPRPSASRKRR